MLQVVGMITVQKLISTAEGGYVGLVEDVIIEPEVRGKGNNHHFVSQPNLVFINVCKAHPRATG